MLEEICQGLWPAVVRQAVEAINAGEPLFAPCERLASFAVTQMEHPGDAVRDSEAGVQRADRAFDTHPSLAARARALGVSLDAGLFDADRVETRAVGMLRDVPRLAAVLQELFKDGLVASGAARPPRDLSRPNFVEEKRLQRVQQAEARKRRAATVAVSDNP